VAKIHVVEVNFDSLCGPTHHFGGLSWGNIASTSNQSPLSHPKKAALEGLEKMKLVSELGVMQAVLPPQLRPNFEALRQCGFCGSDQDIAKKSFKQSPQLFLQCSSSSFMWAANSGTITASIDAKDKKVHITPANLLSNLHRSIEAKTTEHIFRKIFHNEHYFTVHAPVPSSCEFLDEGAANQTRFTKNRKGLYLFVYGVSQSKKNPGPKKFPGRQTKAAFDVITRNHQLPESQIVFAQQQAHAIDAGVFHNDVISTGHETLFMYHEETFYNQDGVIEELQDKAWSLFNSNLQMLPISTKEISLNDAVQSYLFNSQIVTSGSKKVMLAPTECQHNISALKILNNIQKSGTIDKVLFISLTESMKNGGGPACLRIRAPLSEQEIHSLHKGVLFTQRLYEDLYEVIDAHYPDTLRIEQLMNPDFRKQSTLAHSKIMKILQLMP